jgi:hypothetical protein
VSRIVASVDDDGGLRDGWQISRDMVSFEDDGECRESVEDK